jgi:hypothetical protein
MHKPKEVLGKEGCSVIHIDIIWLLLDFTQKSNFWYTDLILVYSSTASTPLSVPDPLYLYPPKGTVGDKLNVNKGVPGVGVYENRACLKSSNTSFNGVRIFAEHCRTQSIRRVIRTLKSFLDRFEGSQHHLLK